MPVSDSPPRAGQFHRSSVQEEIAADFVMPRPITLGVQGVQCAPTPNSESGSESLERQPDATASAL